MTDAATYGFTSRRWPALALALAIAVGVLSSPVAVAEDGGWRFTLTPYGWLAGVKGSTTTVPGSPSVPIDVSPSEALDDSEVSLMVLFQAKKGRHGALLDFMYSDVRSDDDLVPAIGLTLQTVSKTTTGSAAYTYEVYRDEAAVLDVLAGARYWNLDTTLKFGGGLGFLAGRRIAHEESWVDPMVGTKGRVNLGDTRAFLAGSLLAGGFGVGSELFYEASAYLGYQWTKSISTTIGYRMYDVDYEDGGFQYDVTQQGFVVGLGWSF